MRRLPGHNAPGAAGILGRGAPPRVGRSRGIAAPPAGTPPGSTLLGGDLTPTDGMGAGVMEPGGVGLAPHRHARPEICHALAGSGVLAVDGVEVAVGPGTAAFVPGDARHGLSDAGAEALRVFHASPTDSFPVVDGFGRDGA